MGSVRLTERDPMELKDYLRILRAHWVGVLLLIVLATTVAGLWSLSQPKVYAAGANGLVSAGNGSSDPGQQNLSDVLAKSKVKDYVVLATDRSTAQKVIDDLGLDATPESLIGSISVEQPADTNVIKITAKSSTPEGARQLADAWVAALAERVAEIDGAPAGANGQVKGLRIEPSSQAALPTAPVSPRTDLNLLLGLAAGFLLGLAYAVIRSQFDKRIRRADDIEREFTLPVLGSIPDSTVLRHEKGASTPIAVSEESAAGASPTAESFRKLRTNLAFMDVDHPPQVIVMTSPQQSDGKSTLAANLAAAIAATGQKITLIDGDLRRPTIAQAFGLVEGVGVTDVLVGRLSAQEAIQTHAEFPALRVMAAGSRPPNPSELRGSQAMRTLLQELARDGMVIVDAPPLLPVTDAAVISRSADGALVTVSTGRTDRDELRAALSHLEQANGKVLGIILNRVSRRSAGGYYSGYYYSDYSAEPARKGSTGDRKHAASARVET